MQTDLNTTREINEARSKALSEWLTEKLGLPNDRGLMYALLIVLQRVSYLTLAQRLHRPRRQQPGVRTILLDSFRCVLTSLQLQGHQYCDVLREPTEVAAKSSEKWMYIRTPTNNKRPFYQILHLQAFPSVRAAPVWLLGSGTRALTRK